MGYGRSSTTAAVVSMVVATLVLQVQVLQAQNIFVGFYDQSCPQAESIVTQTVQEFNSQDPSTPAALLRLLFHDCFVEVPLFLALSTQMPALYSRHCTPPLHASNEITSPYFAFIVSFLGVKADTYATKHV
jgi:hypothetical protein